MKKSFKLFSIFALFLGLMSFASVQYKWVELGSKEVGPMSTTLNFKVNTTNLINFIKLDVKTAPVTVTNVKVKYKGGQVFEISPNKKFAAGSESGAVKITNYNEAIDVIEVKCKGSVSPRGKSKLTLHGSL